MKFKIATKSLDEMGFSKFNQKITGDSFLSSRYNSASDIAGGLLGKDTIIYLGSTFVKVDGKNKRIIINDGANDRVLIGYEQDGF